MEERQGTCGPVVAGPIPGRPFSGSRNLLALRMEAHIGLPSLRSLGVGKIMFPYKAVFNVVYGGTISM